MPMDQVYNYDEEEYPLQYCECLKNDFISPVFLMPMNMHCESHTAVTQMTDKAHGPFFFIIS